MEEGEEVGRTIKLTQGRVGWISRRERVAFALFASALILTLPLNLKCR
jgi:hypothetical protein